MRTLLKVLFFIFGGLALLTIAFPPIIIMGYFLFIVPGIILTFSPTIAAYLALIIGFDKVLRLLRVPLPHTLSLICVIGIGLFIPYQLNIPIKEQVKEFEKQDVVLNKKFEVPKTIALYSKQYMRHGDACNTLCQLLLYNKAAEKVLLLTDTKLAGIDAIGSEVSYHVENGKNCTNENVTSQRWGKIAVKNVEGRIAAGECLVKSTAKLSEADFIFLHNKISRNEGYQDYKSLKRHIVFANYIELLEKKDSGFEKIYRHTEISAQPYAYPLSFGPILGAGGGNMSLNFGFFHNSLTINNPGASYGNPIQEFKSEMEQLFGDALKTPEATKQDVKKLIKEALSTDTPNKTAGLDVLSNHLADLYSKKQTPTDEDMALVITALKDDRVKDWFYLSSFVGLWSKKRGDVPDELIEELVNRALRKNSRSDIQAASRAIRFLPDGAAKNIYSKLEQIAEDEEIRSAAYGAIIRLGDGGVKAVPKYIAILEEFHDAISMQGHSKERTQRIRKVADASEGAMIGLCRLGKDALPAKDILFSLVNEDNPMWTISELAVDSLIQMGLTEELKQKYESNEKLWNSIQRTIAQKERAERKGKRFCGKRII